MQSYFDRKKVEEKEAAQKKREEQEDVRKKQLEREREERVNRYKGRPDLKANSLVGAPRKEPINESETALLLQAMVSSQHPGIDFVIGDYNTNRGVDMAVEISDKQIPSIKWVELVFSLDNLFKWSHPPGGYHIVVCYELGGVKEKQAFPDGSEAHLVRKETHGRYAMLVGSDTLDVYVLKELLQAGT